MNKTLMHVWITVPLTAALTACTPVLTGQTCPGTSMTETRLYFGLSQAGGPRISDRQFADFVATEVTPRIPEGFTIQDGHGFWKDGHTSRTISENSRILVHLHPSSPASDEALNAMANAYRKRFHQESVLRTDTPTCAAFR